MATQDASQKGTVPIRNGKATLNRLMIELEERLTNYM